MVFIDNVVVIVARLSFSNICIKTFLCLYVRLFVVDAHVARLNKQIEKPVFSIPISRWLQFDDAPCLTPFEAERQLTPDLQYSTLITSRRI